MSRTKQAARKKTSNKPTPKPTAGPSTRPSRSSTKAILPEIPDEGSENDHDYESEEGEKPKSKKAKVVPEDEMKVKDDEGKVDGAKEKGKVKAKKGGDTGKKDEKKDIKLEEKQDETVMTAKEFMDRAQTLLVVFGSQGRDKEYLSLAAKAEEFSTGSFGWTASKDATFPVGETEEMVDVQISLNITVKQPPQITSGSTSSVVRGSAKAKAKTGPINNKRKAGAAVNRSPTESESDSPKEDDEGSDGAVMLGSEAGDESD